MLSKHFQVFIFCLWQLNVKLFSLWGHRLDIDPPPQHLTMLTYIHFEQKCWWFSLWLCGSILKKSCGHRKMEALHVRMCRQLRWLKAPLFTVAEESGWNRSDALDQMIIHHLLRRLGQGETGDTQPIPADDKKSSRCQKINHSITVSLETTGWWGRSYKKPRHNK